MNDFDIILETIETTCSELKTLLKDKGDDYANDSNRFANFEKMGMLLDQTAERTFVMYLSIKITRLAELFKSGKTPKNESVEDTLKDLIGYAMLFMAYRKKKQNGK